MFRLVSMSHIIGRGLPRTALAPASSVSSRRYAGNDSNINDHDFRHSEELAKERYDIRSGEDVERKRARLLYQSRKRGMLENGVILASFADKYLSKFDAEQLDEYDRLINLPTNDWDIFYWATKTKPTPVEFETPVMQKLREHLRNKVSSEEGKENASSRGGSGAEGDQQDFDEGEQVRAKDSVLGKSRPDDIVMPASKSVYEIEIDPVEQDLVNYKENLFDNRIKKFKAAGAIQLMTDWRKHQLERRLRRGLSQPISLRNLSDSKKSEIFTQKARVRGIARERPYPRSISLMDTKQERIMKHHNFLQHLSASDFTADVRDYDDEIEAWAEMIWHRDYGSLDHRLAPSSKICSRCQKKLHCCDPGVDGFIPVELFTRITMPQLHESDQSLSEPDVKCQRCKFVDTYKVNLSAEVGRFTYDSILENIGKKDPSIVCLLIDLTDFPSGIWPDLCKSLGRRHKLIVIGNKLDLLPYDGPGFFERIEGSLRSNLHIMNSESSNLNIHDTILMSARTGFGVEGLITRIADICENNQPRDIYLIGSNNSGKSTLFNALLQSDLSAIRQGDILSRVTSYDCQSTDLKLLRFPLNEMEGWEVETKKRRMIMVERNEAKQVTSLKNTSLNRQESMPHLTLLSNRLHYSATKDELPVKFSDDHPMAEIESSQPLSAQPQDLKYLHYTPSVTTPNQIHDLLTTDELLDVMNFETIVPRKYTLRPFQTLFIAGLARLDLRTASTFANLIVFASKHLPVHCVPTRIADKFYTTLLGSPSRTLKPHHKDVFAKGAHGGVKDIVLSSVGWVMISLTPDQECLIRPYTLDARGIFERSPPMLKHAHKISTGKKIRDTPIFEHKHFESKRMPA